MKSIQHWDHFSRIFSQSLLLAAILAGENLKVASDIAGCRHILTTLSIISELNVFIHSQSESKKDLTKVDAASGGTVDNVDLEVQRLLSVYDVVKDEESLRYVMAYLRVCFLLILYSDTIYYSDGLIVSSLM